MGTLVSISIIHQTRAAAEEAIGSAFEEMGRLIDLFNRFDPVSAVAQLNQQGRLDHAPPELVDVVSQARAYHRLSDGAFDITVTPLVDLYRERFSSGLGEPTRSELSSVLELVGSENIKIDRRGIELNRSGMAITLDGIGKGYIVDKMADHLDRRQIESFLINAGGDIRAGGGKGNHPPWTVAVRDPWNKDRFSDVIRIATGAVATSGGYEIYYDEKKRFHHIVSARTGKSPRTSAGVSVLAPTTRAADALATALFVMDPRDGLELIGSFHGFEYLIIDGRGRPTKSKGWNVDDFDEESR
jgi:thiamine biosynthesis lipoprotein